MSTTMLGSQELMVWMDICTTFIIQLMHGQVLQSILNSVKCQWMYKEQGIKILSNEAEILQENHD